MRLRWRWIAVLALALGAALPARAETVHLVTGEVIKGKIVRADPDSISVESDKGYGVIQIRRSDVTLIEFDEGRRDLSRTIGVGATGSETGVDALSVKMWLSKTDSVDLQVGFYSASTSGVSQKVFEMDVRYATVIRRQAQSDVYLGGSVGYLNVSGTALGSTATGTGYSVRGFAGVELFLTALPNIGISAEVGVGMQKVGDTTTTTLFTSTIPALTLRYYF